MTKREQVDKKMFKIELDKGNTKKFKVKTICKSKIFIKKLNSSYHLPGLYYLVL